jgi:prepilin-type processing-associated H-X9-DG protein/prepilin-type N-terminal cleavage/methylation domain-containing protein
MRRRCAFTLVELLVVVAIVTILIALLMPALVGARRKAQTIVCAANLRTIGQAMAMYTQRYRVYPCWYISDQGNRYAIWPVRLRPFTDGNQDVFYCPAQDERCRWEKVEPLPGAPGRATESHAAFGYEVGEPLIDENKGYFSYGYNGIGAGQDWDADDDQECGLGQLLDCNPPASIAPYREVRANRVRVPSAMIAVTDSTADGMSDAGVGPNVYPDPRYNVAQPGAVHSGGTNVLFCDGHVQWSPKKSLLVTYGARVPSEDPIRRMWNRNNKANSGPRGN